MKLESDCIKTNPRKRPFPQLTPDRDSCEEDYTVKYTTGQMFTIIHRFNKYRKKIDEG